MACLGAAGLACVVPRSSRTRCVRIGRVLELLLACILECEVELVATLLIGSFASYTNSIPKSRNCWISSGLASSGTRTLTVSRNPAFFTSKINRRTEAKSRNCRLNSSVPLE
jgi:hypothetical protein